MVEFSWEMVWAWLETSGVESIEVIALGVIVYFITLFVVKWLLRGIIKARLKSKLHKVSEREMQKRQKTLYQLFKTIIKIIVTLSVLFNILDKYFGISLVPLFASAGIVGVALGFGAQNIVKDSLAGLFIILENQFRVGDFIEIDGTGMDRAKGTVEKISIRSTMIRDREGDVHFIPNGQMVQVINRTLGLSKVLFTIKVAMNTDAEEVKKLINEVGTEMVATKKWGDKIKEAVRFKEFGEFDSDGYEITIGGITDPGEQWNITSEYRERLLARFEKEHIKLV